MRELRHPPGADPRHAGSAERPGDAQRREHRHQDGTRAAPVIGGLDALSFTGGVGEHAPAVRAGAAARLAFLGVELDPAANEDARGDAGIAAAGAGVRCAVVAAREDLEMACQARRALAA